MTIDKAIEILTIYMKGSDEAEPVDFDNSILLGIEALKRIKAERTGYETYAPDLLPGETEE